MNAWIPAMRTIALALSVSLIVGLACFGFLFFAANTHAAMDAGAALDASRTGTPCCTGALSAHRAQRTVALIGAAASYTVFAFALLAFAYAALRRVNRACAVARCAPRAHRPIPHCGHALRAALATGIVHPKIF